MRTTTTRRMRALTARVFLGHEYEDTRRSVEAAFLGFARGGAAQRRCVMVILKDSANQISFPN